MKHDEHVAKVIEKLNAELRAILGDTKRGFYLRAIVLAALRDAYRMGWRDCARERITG